MKKISILTIFVILVFNGCFGGESKQEWTSLIYPDKNNTKRSKKHEIFATLEECKQGSIKELEKLGLQESGDYQCGLNCKFHEGMKMDICEKLTK